VYINKIGMSFNICKFEKLLICGEHGRVLGISDWVAQFVVSDEH
jgi:hypothetical protein